MRSPNGYAFVVSPDPNVVTFDHETQKIKSRREVINAGTYETDTVMCGHCGRHMHIRPYMDPADMGGLCKQCMKFECPECVGKGCTPLEKKLQEAEERDRIRRSYGLP